MKHAKLRGNFDWTKRETWDSGVCPEVHVTEVEESKRGGLFHGGETTSEGAKNQAGLLVVRMGRIKEQNHLGEDYFKNK